MTAGDLIKASLEDLGVVDPGAGPSAEDYATGLTTLNTLLKITATQRLGVFTVVTENFSLSAGTVSYTYGTGGVFNSVRPHKIITAFARDASNNDYPMDPISREDYSVIGLKSISGSFPEKYYYEPENPLGKIFLYPAAGSGYSLHVQAWKPLTAVAAIANDLALPDEYEGYLQYNLAVMLAPKYRVQVPQEVAEMAGETRRILKNLHAQPVQSVQTNPIRKTTSFDINRGY